MPHHLSGISCTVHRKYLLTCENYDSLWERSGGACEVCGTPGNLVIDHDHRYGRAAVRGLLCNRCNQTLGALDRLMPFPAVRHHNPSHSFREYYERAWFVGNTHERQAGRKVHRRSADIWQDLVYYRRAAAALLNSKPTDLLLPLSSPRETAEALRKHMSPQGFAILVRLLVKMRETPKRDRQ
ncbi:endonuclease domain-containing protein [Kitasatospora sp. NPDC086791]|uniref:endonuclease domain-containing protein n=1 Tax=Kitasatospora sp. NPDC086791 TaxID=3155178 RepID=UPI003420A54F